VTLFEALFYKSLEVMRDLVRGAFYKVPRGLCVTLFEALFIKSLEVYA